MHHYIAHIVLAASIASAIRPTIVDSLNVVTTGHGTPVVLIPGLAGSAFGYRKVAALLNKSGYQAIVVEPLGVGDSPRPRRADYSLTAQADRLAAAIERLHEGPAVVIAHGISGSMALRLAYRHPQVVRGLVLLEGGPARTAATPSFRRAMRLAPVIRLVGNEERFRNEVRKSLEEASGDASWVTEEVVQGYAASGTADLQATIDAFAAMSEAVEPEDLDPNLGRITCPVELLLGGARHAGAVDRDGIDALRRNVPQSAVYTIPGVGHFIHEERPGFVLTSLQRVMRRSRGEHEEIAQRADADLPN